MCSGLVLDQGVADCSYRRSGKIDDVQGKAASTGQATTINQGKVGYARSAFLHLPQNFTHLYFKANIQFHH